MVKRKQQTRTISTRRKQRKGTRKSRGGANPQCKKFINQKCLSIAGGNHDMKGSGKSPMAGVYQCSKCARYCDNY